MEVNSRPTYNLMDYLPYANMFYNLMSWSIRVKPELHRKDREEFVRNIINKNHHYLIDDAYKEWKKLEVAIIEERHKIYESYDKKLHKWLAGASIGECFLFISRSGDKHYLKCVGEKKCQGYDYNEWCVSERDYTYTIPIFEDPTGRRCSYTGLAILIPEETFKRQKI